MSSENDSPSTDDGGRNAASQTVAPHDAAAAAAAAAVTDAAAAVAATAAAAADECDSDVHSCGRCKLQFSNIDDFIKHKLQHGDCRLQYSKSGHLKLPKLIKKDAGGAALVAAESAPSADADSEQPTAGKRRRGRPRKVRDVSESDGSCQSASTGNDRALTFGERAAAAAAAVGAAAATAVEALPEHKCSTCGTSFHRKAALKCHLLREHGVGSDAGSDLDDDDDEGDDGGRLDGYDSADNEWSDGVALESTGSSRLAAAAAVGGGGGSASVGGGPGDGGGYGRKRRSQSTAAGGGGGGVPMAQAYSCEKCPKVFSSVDTLRAHGVTHAEDRGYPCTVEDCHFAFKTKGSLKRHLRRHTDERPYKCTVCGRAFRESGALTRHLKSRTPCTNKTDSDLPRYGKSLSLAPSSSTLGSCLGLVAGGGGDLRASGGGSSVAPARGTDAASARAASGPGSVEPRAAAGVLGGTAEPGADDGTNILSNIQRCCQVCRALFSEAEQLMEHLRSHLVQQQHQQPVQCGLCGHTAASGDALDEHVAQMHATELDAKVIDEALDEAPTLVDVEMDSDTAGAILYSAGGGGTDAHLHDQTGDADDVAEVAGSGLQAVGDGEASASSLNGSYPSMSENGTGDIVVVKLNDDEDEDDEESRSSGGDSSSKDGPEGTDEVGDESVGRSAVSDPDALRVKRVRDSTVAVQQLLQLSALLAASQAAASLGSQAASDVSSIDRELTASQSTKMAVALAQRTCPVCKRTFKAGSYLRLHMRSHTGERPHKCPHCPKDFATKDTFNKHLLAHSDERLYKCGDCGKMFKRISHVKEHLKIHSSDRPYPCSTCDKTFKTSNAWKVHMRTHSQVMAWQCSSCPRQFREKSSLVRHARTHTGERPYPCKFCGRHFSEHGTLNRHLRAKVPCTAQLSQLRLVHQSLCDDSVANYTVSSAVGTTPDGFPTVLTEFSTVVADTQYINPDGSSTTVKSLEQCIVLERDGSLEELQTVLPKAESSLGQHDADGVGLPTFYVVRTSDSNLRVHYSCDDELLQQDGHLYTTEAVVMLQSPATGSESAVIVSSGNGVRQMTPRTVAVGAEPMSTSSDIADCGGTVLVPMVDEDEGSTIVVNSSSG